MRVIAGGPEWAPTHTAPAPATSWSGSIPTGIGVPTSWSVNGSTLQVVLALAAFSLAPETHTPWASAATRLASISSVATISRVSGSICTTAAGPFFATQIAASVTAKLHGSKSTCIDSPTVCPLTGSIHRIDPGGRNDVWRLRTHSIWRAKANPNGKPSLIGITFPIRMEAESVNSGGTGVEGGCDVAGAWVGKEAVIA